MTLLWTIWLRRSHSCRHSIHHSQSCIAHLVVCQSRLYNKACMACIRECSWAPTYLPAGLLQGLTGVPVSMLQMSVFCLNG